MEKKKGRGGEVLDKVTLFAMFEFFLKEKLYRYLLSYMCHDPTTRSTYSKRHTSFFRPNTQILCRELLWVLTFFATSP